MAFTVVFSNGEPRDYGAFDKYEVTDRPVANRDALGTAHQNVTTDHGLQAKIDLRHNGFGRLRAEDSDT
jgi:hypothetical protein